MNQKFLKIELPLIIYLFLLLFLPPIVKNVNLLIFLSFISFLILVIKYYDESLQIIKSKHVSKVIKYLLLYYFWYFFILLINGLMTKNFYWYNYFITFYSMILVFPLIFICILCIVIYCKKNDLSFDDIVKCIIYAGLIQSAFTLLSFIFPWFKTFLINIMYNNTGEILYKNSYSLRRRFFGFANNLLDSFGYGTGIIAILPLFYSIKNGKKWLYTMPFLLLVPTLNSRTGLVVFGIGFIFWIIYCIKEKIIQKYLKLIMYLVSSVFLVFSIVYIFYPTTIGWILNDFLSFFHITSGTAGVLFSKSFMTLPSNFFNLIFGAGYTVAAYGGIVDKIGFGSDVGYINEIWKTGLIGVVFLSYLFIKMLNKVKQKLPKEYKYFTLFLIISTFVVNIKFYVFTCNSGMTIIILLYLFTIYNLSIKPKNVINEKIDEQELISVIVPVYNIEKYLNRCLTSIVNQTYKKIEIILINDGSTDNSEQICKEFAQKDDRIKYFKQKNQGLSAARNTGMEHATGNYYVFIDSDDYVNVHFIESLYSALKTANTKLAVCNYKKVYEDLENIQTTGDGQIEIIDNEYPKKLEPVSPIKVFAG